MDVDTRESLRRRIQLATEEDQIYGMICDSAFRAIRELLGDELAESARVSSWPVPQWVSLFRYPVADMLRLVDAAAELSENRGILSYGGMLERIGGFIARHLHELPLSKAYSLTAGNNPHDRLALSASSSSRLATTFGERSYERLGPTQARLLFQRELLGPSWVLGGYTATARSFTSLHMTVTLEHCHEPGMDFQLLFAW